MGAIIDKIKGKAKQIEGRLTGDKIRETQGTVEKAKGDVEMQAQRVASRVNSKGRRIKARVGRSKRR